MNVRVTGSFSAAAAGVGLAAVDGQRSADSRAMRTSRTLDAAAVDERDVDVEALTGCDRRHRRWPWIEGTRRLWRAGRLRHGGERDTEHGLERLGCLAFLRPEHERHIFVHCLADGAPQQSEGTCQRGSGGGRVS